MRDRQPGFQRRVQFTGPRPVVGIFRIPRRDRCVIHGHRDIGINAVHIGCKWRAGNAAIIDEFHPLVGRRTGAPERDGIGNPAIGFGDGVVQPSQFTGSGAPHPVVGARGNPCRTR